MKGMDWLSYCYSFLLIIRFVLTLLPQTGYIQADEFFQSPEIIYGDLLNLHEYRPWEFNPENPLRCITFPYLTVGIPAAIIKLFGFNLFFGTTVLPYLLLVLPRLMMCILSLVHDVCLYKICKLLNIDFMKLLVIYASSYITLVHFTHTFSNSLEAVCYTILNYFVIKNYVKSINFKEHKIDANKNSEDIKYGIIVALGCFIRPTFVVFSVAPISLWVIFSSKSYSEMFKKVLFFIPGFIAVSLFLAAVDTFYYAGDTNLTDFRSASELLEKLILTPVNFIKYNSDSKKVSSHGNHPRFLHFIVNVPMTFTVLGCYGVWKFFRMTNFVIKNRKLTSSTLQFFFLLSFIVPTCILSIMPHQEPRFLLPLLLPLVLLCGETVFSHCMKFKSMAALWITANLIGLVVFGFLHQGGMYSALSSLHTVIAKNTEKNINLVFYHTYMPPRHLMAIPDTQKNIKIYDVGERPGEDFISTVETLMRYSHHGESIYIIAPSALTIPIVNINVILSPDYKLKLEESIFPHLSTEDLYFYNLWQAVTSRASLYYKARKLKTFFSLNIYKVETVTT